MIDGKLDFANSRPDLFTGRMLGGKIITATA
jgi:hypothetical protein